ncbi:MAG: HyaD/HybD family hydrogenase maturation endopeptidase [Desulfobulbaceae bacterium]|jgi:hydrogenase maturation protease|nr:HyaD/HybD family hydrogenase maturation endopeptidase [Desulfobulbaceae bacterium]
MSNKNKRILVLGVGNILLGDEGAGVRAMEMMQDRYDFSDNVEFLDGGTAGFELLSYLDDKTDLFIFDAIIDEGKPGTVKRFNLDNPPAFFQNRISPHQLGLSEMLSTAALTDNLPAHITLFGIVPKTIDTGMELTGPVRVGVEQMVDMAIDELQTIGAVL